MKRLVAFLLLIIFSLSLASCGGSSAMVKDAIDELEEHWEDFYDEHPKYAGDGYFEIKNTRVVYIKENDIPMLEDVKCIIEFELYTDYYGSAPYYTNVHMYDNVVVYNDGSMDVQSHIMQSYLSMYFSNDFSDIIESVKDYEDKYNCVKNLT